MSVFGDKLKSLREKENLTQGDLAKKLGVTQRFISYYEKGNSIPNDPDILNKLVSLFNVSLDYLLLDRESDSTTEAPSKIHLQIKKLINDTDKRFIKWNALDNLNDNYTEANNVDNFLHSIPKYKNSSLNPAQSYMYWHNGTTCGGYIIAKIFFSANDPANFEIVMLIEYNENLYFIANEDSINAIGDLYFSIVNTSSGIDEFIDDYLNDDLQKTTPEKLTDEDIPF